MTGRHVLMLLSNPYTHDPRVRAEARSLVEAGHRVTVVAWDRPGAGPEEEMLDGARVLRVPHTRPMRWLRYDLFRLRGWWRLAVRKGVAVHRDDPVGAVHAHDLDTLPAAVRLKARLGVPLVYDAHELWPQMLARDVPWPAPAWFAAKERRLVRRVDAVVTVNDLLVDHFRALVTGGTPVVLVMNAKPLVVDRYRPPRGDAFEVLYIGHMSPSRFVVESIEALADLDGVTFRLAGGGHPAYMERVRAAASAAPNVLFMGRVPSDDVLPMTLASDVVARMMDPSDPNNRVASGNKLFEAMAAGRPIIVTEGTNDARLVEKEAYGLVVPYTKAGFRAAVVRLQGDPELARSLGRRALEAAKREYNWDVQRERLLALYARL